MSSGENKSEVLKYLQNSLHFTILMTSNNIKDVLFANKILLLNRQQGNVQLFDLSETDEKKKFKDEIEATFQIVLKHL